MDKKYEYFKADMIPDISDADLDVESCEEDVNTPYIDTPIRGRCRMNNVKLTGLGDDLWQALRFKH